MHGCDPWATIGIAIKHARESTKQAVMAGEDEATARLAAAVTWPT
jgi:hypothetical protein